MASTVHEREMRVAEINNFIFIHPKGLNKEYKAPHCHGFKDYWLAYLLHKYFFMFLVFPTYQALAVAKFET